MKMGISLPRKISKYLQKNSLYQNFRVKRLLLLRLGQTGILGVGLNIIIHNNFFI